jgi:hypothetical protein
MVGKLESENTQVYAQKPRLKMMFKNTISGKATMNANGKETLRREICDMVGRAYGRRAWRE